MFIFTNDKGGLFCMRKNLLLLHQIYPVSYNKISPLRTITPQLDEVVTMPTKQLQQLLRTSFIQAQNIQHYMRTTNYDAVVEDYHQRAINIVMYGDALYPPHLYDMYDPPAILYVKGNETLLKRRKVAIIGSREATQYSQDVINWLVPACRDANMTIVSGLARGADTMAHLAAMATQATTIAVLGHGLQHMYPPEHRALAEQMSTQQLLLTEYPYHVAPQRWHFPMRNRIISALSDAVVVTEAAKKSGTMSTVDYALAHGKDIYALPGNIFSKLSEGPNALIAEGATPLLSLEHATFLQHL